VQPVRELDQNDPDVAGHRQHHLPEVRRLRLGPRREVDLRQLADAIDQLRHLVVEPRRDLALRSPGILEHVVQDGGDETLMVHLHLGQDAGDREGMVDVRLPRAALLTGMGLGAEEIRIVDLGDLRRRQVFLQVMTEVADQVTVFDGTWNRARLPLRAAPAWLARRILPCPMRAGSRTALLLITSRHRHFGGSGSAGAPLFLCGAILEHRLPRNLALDGLSAEGGRIGLGDRPIG
jgi:hypothetical protein